MRRNRILRGPVGGDEPRRPERSLPSYGEPTPETHRRLTREEEAELALTGTVFTPGTALLLVVLFVLTIACVPFIQLVAGLRGGAGWQTSDLFKTLPWPSAEELKSAEKSLENDSVVSQWLLPWAQSLLVGQLRAGNEQVYLGRDGWLFYRPDVDYLTGPPFAQPDPIKAVVQFRDQLAVHGIELIVLPLPVKPSIEGNMLAGAAGQSAPLQNGSFAEFKAQLASRGVRLFDPTPILMKQKPRHSYLQTDTHWRPETMELVAQELAKRSGDILAEETGDKSRAFPKEIMGVGDVARMLKLPDNQQIYSPERITIRQVTTGSGLWRPTRDADVLLLGDSFANIFSLDALGWGESAGFAEHLSLALGGRPLDCILRNNDGAFATREMLANELARGRDRLAGKKLVVWEFAARELALGNWKLIDLKLGSPPPSRFFIPRLGDEIEVTGTVEAISSIPRPGTVPYKDHVMAVHLADFTLPGRGEPLQALVYLLSMRDNAWTVAARLRPGDRVTLRLKPWAAVAAQYDQINRSEIEDPELQLEEPVWGELK